MVTEIDLVIRNGQVVTATGVQRADLTVADGKIVSIGEAEDTGADVIDAAGKWVMPGGVDPHAHIEQPSGMGVMNADTFETATRSAAFGGTTTVISFAAQRKGERLADVVADYAQRAQRGAMIDHAFHMIVSDPTVPDFEDDLARLIAAGHRTIKVFTTYNIRLDDAQIRRIMVLARNHGALVCVHAENHTMIEAATAKVLATGTTLPYGHALSRPRRAEIEAVERICQMADTTQARVMLFHISTKEGVEAVQAARARGVPILAETCPHYLFMTEDVLKQPDSGKWICSPPPRHRADQEALWTALEAGHLQLVSSDHAPYRYDETGKLSAGPNPPFPQIASGIPGLETRLPLLFDAMVSQGRGGPEAFAKLTATAPADIYDLPAKGRIAPGYDADLVIWDHEREVTYGENDLHDNVGYNPWVGRRVKGWPETVILRGQVLVADGTFYGTPGIGNWLHRAAPQQTED